MAKVGGVFLTLLSGLSLAVAAQAQEAPSIDVLFEAADRGEIAPIERALADEHRDDVTTLLRARLAAARMDANAANDPALARLAAQTADPALRRAALGIITSVSFANGDYAEAARAGRLLEQALVEGGQQEEAASAARTRGLAELLVGRPARSIDGAVATQSIAARYDRVGLPRIDVSVNGVPQEALVDTGANLSVLSRETARRFGIEILAGETRVANGVQGTVPVRIGVADRVEIAGTVFRNVSFLIIDDEQLTFPIPGGYDIRAIIGLPELRALGRVQIDNEGRFAVLAAGEVTGGASNLRASGNDLFVEVSIDGDTLPLHLDTGANQTSLSALYAAGHPAAAALEAGEARLASAGGARVARTATWRQAPLSLAGRSLRLPTLPVTLPAEGPRPSYYGTLGSNALRAFTSYTIDFAAMRLDLGPPAAAAPAP